jgi:cytoskeletal protein CcmA (bactofilin family)
MFGSNKKQGLLKPELESFDTIIDKTTTIHGRLSIEGSIRIDGTVMGNIECTSESENENITVAVGVTGMINGDIRAYRVLVAGKVEGNIYATEKVELHDSAIVVGDITYNQLGIEHGAEVLGLMIKKVDSKKQINHASSLIKKIQETSFKSS